MHDWENLLISYQYAKPARVSGYGVIRFSLAVFFLTQVYFLFRLNNSIYIVFAYKQVCIRIKIDRAKSLLAGAKSIIFMFVYVFFAWKLGFGARLEQIVAVDAAFSPHPTTAVAFT